MKLSKMKVTTDLIAKFHPCESRFSNWKFHHNDFKGDILDFLSLTTITPQDKVWVCCRILPRDLVEVFAIDCAVQAQGYAAADAAAAYAADAATATATADAAAAAADATAYAYAAAYAAYAAADAAAAYAAYAAERERQVDALIYLVMNHN